MMAVMLSENRILKFNSTSTIRSIKQGLAYAMVCVSTLLIASAASALTLDDMSYTSLPGDRVQLRLQLSEPVGSDMLSFTIDNPARVAIDFPGTSLNLEQKSQNIGIGNAEQVTAVEAEGRTRVVVNLTSMVPYDLSSDGNIVTLILEGAGADIGADMAGDVATLPGSSTDAQINDIDFRRGTGGEPVKPRRRHQYPRTR
jgi:type IV pilus assembly protein PilQ